MSDPWRNRYVASRLKEAESAKNSHTIRLRRDATLAQVGSPISYAGILAAAVDRARAAHVARGLSDSLYGVWHQHNTSKTAVFDQFRKILKDLGLSVMEAQVFIKELDDDWGSGASLYFE